MAGIKPQTPTGWEFQSGLVQMQFFMEDYFVGLASAYPDDKPIVLLCDRGAIDGKAFCDPKDWSKALLNMGLVEAQVRDSRYDAVIHMVTAADGAGDFYTLSNNAARLETPEQAIAADRKLQAAWLGHPARLRIIDNSTGFDEKIRRVGDEVCRILELGGVGGQVRKFKLPLRAGRSLLRSGIDLAQVSIRETQLQTPGGEPKMLRKRTVDGFDSFFYVATRDVEGVAVRESRIVSAAEYTSFLRDADKAHRPIQKTRYCYLYDNCHHELDIYKSPKIDFCLLTVEGFRDPLLPVYLIEAVVVPSHTEPEDILALNKVVR